MNVFEYDEINNIENLDDKRNIEDCIILVKCGPVNCSVINDGKSCCLYPNKNNLLDGINKFSQEISIDALKEIFSGRHDNELAKDFKANNKFGRYCICTKTAENKYTIVLLDGYEFATKTLELYRFYIDKLY